MSEAALDRPLAGTGRDGGRVVSPFEFWPGWLTYTPIVLHWLLLGLRHGSFSLPTAANPAISTGGLCGESKSAILDQVGGQARAFIAPYTTIVTGADDAATARAAMRRAGLSLPLVVKPDIGCNGAGVRLVESEAGLDAALACFDRGVRLVLQALVGYEGEAGVFYIRHPDQPSGRITSLTLKSSPTVTGDGVLTLRDLIHADPRTGAVPHLYLDRFAHRLDSVPEAGQTVRLVFAGNHCKGSVFRNGAGEITAALTARIEAIARALPDFHFGRIDLRYASLPALRGGHSFQIIEINGVGSEATHIWDPDTTLPAAYAAQFQHYGEAFRIGAAMRRRGATPSSLRTMLRDWRQQRRLMARYPLND